MLPFLCKKASEARAALDHYEGKVTGNELNSVFENEVKEGRRERKWRKVRINTPYLRPIGDRLMRELRNHRLRDAFGRFRAEVTPEDYERIRDEHFIQGKRLRDLVKEYPQYARETIRRVLGGGRGCVGVKGVGRVETTDSR
jgi:(2Fe-2S) ferredoxin